MILLILNFDNFHYFHRHRKCPKEGAGLALQTPSFFDLSILMLTMILLISNSVFFMISLILIFIISTDI